MPSKIRKRGQSRWLARVQKDRKVRQKICSTKAEALAWETEQRSTDWTTPTDYSTVIDWANKYLDYSLARFARTTYQEKHGALSRLLKAVPPQALVDSLTPAQVLNHLTREARCRSGYAANKDRKNLAAAWNWGVKYLGLPMPNPVAAVDRFPERRQDRYVPPEADLWAVLEVTKGQDRIMLLCFVYLAARRGEIFRLTWEDVDFGMRRVRLYTRKRKDGTEEFEWLPMADELGDGLKWWHNHRTFQEAPHVFLCEDQTAFCQEYFGRPFKQRRHFMKRLCECAGVKPFGFHAIRHLTATILYKRGYPQSVIQAILRHKNPGTTARYIKRLGLEEARPALNDLRRQPARVIPFPQNKPSQAKAQEGVS